MFDAIDELRRQTVLVDDCQRRLATIIAGLPRVDAMTHWRGAARDALQQAVELERARLGREVNRLDGVRIQLAYAVEQAAGESAPPADR